MAFLKPFLPAFTWAAVILVLTLLPSQALPKIPEWKVFSINSLAHLGVFLVWAFLLLIGFFRFKTNSLPGKYDIILTLVLAVSYGALIELLQGLMRLGRQPDLVDIVYNTIGALLGIVLFYSVKSYKRI